MYACNTGQCLGHQITSFSISLNIAFTNILSCAVYNVKHGDDVRCSLQQAYRVRHGNQSGVPIKFCGTMEELIMEGCTSNSLVGPTSGVVREVSDNIMRWIFIPYVRNFH